MKCRKGYEVKPLKSGGGYAGYYKGTLDEEGFPQCRLSTEYAKTEQEAEKLPCDRQFAMENEFCNGGCGCFKPEYDMQRLIDYANEIKSEVEMLLEDLEDEEDSFLWVTKLHEIRRISNDALTHINVTEMEMMK